MNIIQALLTILAPALVFILPGIVLLDGKKKDNAIIDAARVCLWSLAIAVLVTLAVTALHLPFIVAVAIMMSITLIAGMRSNYAAFLRGYWQLGLIVIGAAVAYVIVSIPFITFHQGLPTGDAQKAMYFGQEIINTRSLPNYALSPALLNRDPVDFYTPGLHTLTAMIMDISPYPYFSIGFFSIAASIALVIMGAALAAVLNPSKALPTAVIAALFIATHVRFLRYVREPGYHLQNVVGEVLLFGFILLLVLLLNQWRRSNAMLAVLTMIALVAVHQFSTFIAVFMATPIILLALWQYRISLLQRAARPYVVTGLALIIAVIISLFYQLDLTHKMKDLFTGQPHLIADVPRFMDYFMLMGRTWMTAGVAGLLFVAWLSWKKRSVLLGAFIGSTLVLLFLTQGPRFSIDIPSVRALLYAVIPLSVLAAIGVNEILSLKQQIKERFTRWAVTVVIALAVFFITVNSVSSAFTLSHTIRTNATLTAGIQSLIENIMTTPKLQPTQGVIADTYNRQSLTWLLVTAQPTFARLASDIKRANQESKQSDLRQALYLHQLDFEKIYSLGSLPLVATIMNMYSVTWVTGVAGSSQSAFDHNPLLKKAISEDDVTLYAGSSTPVPPTYQHLDSLSSWLLAPTTLVNDVGDDEDTLLHLPASLTATRLSPPRFEHGRTFRVTTAPFITLNFNVDTYVSSLWDVRGQDVQGWLLIDTVFAPANLSLRTPSGVTIPFPEAGAIVSLPASDLKVNDQGFVTITLINPSEQPIALDVVALGLATKP